MKTAFLQFQKALKVIFLAMAIMQVGVLVGAATTVYMEIQTPNFDTIMLVINAAVVATTLAASYLVSNNQLAKIQQINDLQKKIALFRTQFIVRLALMESGVLLSGVLCFLNAQLIHLAFGGISFLVFLTAFPPSGQALYQAMHLTGAQIKQVGG